ncbi:MAG: hypothetical protein C0469_07680 [Cyanobacteria bacterium DS2.3.42]|nr:hypothetical protein [Cyanobacteria bacterium DS2.3.42]
MASAVNSRADYAKLLEPTLRKAFFAEYDLGGEVYSQYWDVQDSDKASEEISETVMPSEIPEVNEGGMFARGVLSMGRSKKFTHVTRKLEIVMTEEIQEDNLYKAALSTQKGLAIAMKRTVERLTAVTYANGLTTELTPDGKPVFAPDHVVLYPQPQNPSSWGNVLSGEPFSSVGVKKLKTLMRKQKDENGDTLPHNMDQLIVPSDLAEEAYELYGAPGTYDRADRAGNQVKQGIKDVIVVDHFQDVAHQYASTMYFGRDSRMAMNIFFWRVRPTYKLIYEEATGNIIQRVRCRFSLGVVNPRGQVAAYGV